MSFRLTFALLTLLLCSGCLLPPQQTVEEAVLPQEPSPAQRLDEDYRQRFRLGIEELAQQQTTQLEELAVAAPDTLWGTTARQILDLNSRLTTTTSELTQLQKTQKGLTRRQDSLQQENLELKKKLEELTRLLVELEKRPH
jgi:chromosome segregation ATPase